MAWAVEFTKDGEKQLTKLDRTAARRIVRALEELAAAGRPRDTGKPLKGNLAEYWRYRVGSYRMLCMIDDVNMRIVVVEVGHRQSIYE